MKRLLASLAALALAGCSDARTSVWALPQDQWACTKETVVSVRPYLVQCTQYSMLR